MEHSAPSSGYIEPISANISSHNILLKHVTSSPRIVQRTRDEETSFSIATAQKWPSQQYTAKQEKLASEVEVVIALSPFTSEKKKKKCLSQI